MNKISDFISSIYSTALNVQNFDHLIALSEQTLADGSAKQAELHKLRSECEKHVSEAEKLLHQLPDDANDHFQKPIFFVTPTGKVEDPNEIACTLFGMKEGDLLDVLLDRDNLEEPGTGNLNESDGHVAALRLRSCAGGKPVVMIPEPSSADGRVRFVGMDAVWHDTAEKAVQALYGLTPSEAEVLGLLMSGHSPNEVAAVRDRSVETIRQQIKALTQKMQSSGLQEAIQLARAVSISCRPPNSDTRADSRKRMILSDGRSIDFQEQGAPDGHPILFLHGCLGVYRLPHGADKALEEAGLRLIAPARPWHGDSCGHEPILQKPGLYSKDLIALADHLKIDAFSLLAFDTGSIFALTAAKELAERLTSIVCVAAQPPMRSMSDFASAPQQQRIFTVLARTSLPLLRYLSLLGDRKLKKEGRGKFAETVFSGSEADLEACRDDEVLDLMWHGHHFHVENGSDSFINDCRLVASNWNTDLDLPSCSVRFVHGVQDASIPPDRIRTFAERLNAEIVWVEGAGHTLPFSHWQPVIDASIADLSSRQNPCP